MSLLTIYKDDYNNSTVISNQFIDEYMKDANEAEIKVYLYLVRMMNANLSTSVADIAYKFNHTEREVKRALEYWEKCGLVSLEFNSSNDIIGIRFLSQSQAENVRTQRTPAEIIPLKIVSDDRIYKQAGKQINSEAGIANGDEQVNSSVPKKPVHCTEAERKKFESDPENTQLFYICEEYLGRPLTSADTTALEFMTNCLHFSPELIDALISYCVDMNHREARYFETVAIAWAEKNITSPEDVWEEKCGRFDKYVYTVMKALGRSQVVQTEADYAIRWVKEWQMPLEVVLEACRRTVRATDSHRLDYCDKILEAWRKFGVTDIKAISEYDAARRKARPSKPVGENSFNRFTKTDYDFDALEKILSN